MRMLECTDNNMGSLTYIPHGKDPPQTFNLVRNNKVKSNRTKSHSFKKHFPKTFLIIGGTGPIIKRCSNL